MSYSNLDSKSSRAVAAYLISAGAGTRADVFHAYDSRDQPEGLITRVEIGVARPDVPFCGNFQVPFLIKIIGPASNPIPVAGQPPLNPDAARLVFDARVAATFDALMQSDNGGVSLEPMCGLINAAGRALAVAADGSPAAMQFAANNADMADFSVTQWFCDGFGKDEADGENAVWSKVLLFRGTCCASNVD